MHTSTRLGLDIPDGGDNESAYPIVAAQAFGILDNAAIYQESTFVTRPAANSVVKGTIHRATDAPVLSISDGTSWHVCVLDGGAAPIGSVQQYAGSSDPADPDGTSRWTICDGRALSRTTYSSLFAAISTAYGAGDGSSTFNIPDLRQRFPLGKASSGTGSTLGQTGGAIDHTHSVPGHTHTLANSGVALLNPASGGATDAEFQYSSTAWNWTDAVVLSLTVGHAELKSDASFNTHALALDGATGSTGGTTGTTNPPYVAVNHIIRVL